MNKLILVLLSLAVMALLPSFGAASEDAVPQSRPAVSQVVDPFVGEEFSLHIELPLELREDTPLLPGCPPQTVLFIGDEEYYGPPFPKHCGVPPIVLFGDTDHRQQPSAADFDTGSPAGLRHPAR